MKKNGFISITVIYSFFLVFLSLMMFIIVNTVTSRNLLNNMKKTIKSDISDTNFANYLINRYEELGLVKSGNTYRYPGPNPKNYIRYGNTFFRIVGVFNGKVKLAENPATIRTAAFNSNSNLNDYRISSLRTYLNTEYIATLGDFANLIDTSIWYVGGLDDSFKNKIGSEIYEYEVGANKNNGMIIYDKIGIPYISDYVYSDDGTGYDIAVKGVNNWLFKTNMWFIVKNNSDLISSYYLTTSGMLDTAVVSEEKSILPVFFLKGSVKYVSGSGTASNPYYVG